MLQSIVVNEETTQTWLISNPSSLQPWGGGGGLGTD